MKKKGFAALLLCFVLALALPCVFPASAASSGSCGENVSYTLENGKLTVSGSGEMADWNINNSHTCPPWYDERSTITSVEVKSGVTSVGNCAFNGCDNLTSVLLPNTLTRIGERAFRNCCNENFVDIHLPESLRTLGEHAFANDRYLHMVTIPHGVTELPAYVFESCQGLFDVTVPSTVTSIGANAFLNTPLSDLHYEGAREAWDALKAEHVAADGNGRLDTARIHCDASMAYVQCIKGVTCGRGLT
ncbi:MAG: leucine-rich repeat domain-containing protein, partial [Oscillospiraceae bacterium]|nr:leucine-rich repeat domain-containing protein [Oscillospiraceae bacterium]